MIFSKLDEIEAKTKLVGDLYDIKRNWLRSCSYMRALVKNNFQPRLRHNVDHAESNISARGFHLIDVHEITH